jgi:hypothetical protein
MLSTDEVAHLPDVVRQMATNKHDQQQQHHHHHHHQRRRRQQQQQSEDVPALIVPWVGGLCDEHIRCGGVRFDSGVSWRRNRFLSLPRSYLDRPENRRRLLDWSDLAVFDAITATEDRISVLGDFMMPEYSEDATRDVLTTTAMTAARGEGGGGSGGGEASAHAQQRYERRVWREYAQPDGRSAMNIHSLSDGSIVVVDSDATFSEEGSGGVHDLSRLWISQRAAEEAAERTRWASVRSGNGSTRTAAGTAARDAGRRSSASGGTPTMPSPPLAPPPSPLPPFLRGLCRFSASTVQRLYKYSQDPAHRWWQHHGGGEVLGEERTRRGRDGWGGGYDDDRDDATLGSALTKAMKEKWALDISPLEWASKVDARATRVLRHVEACIARYGLHYAVMVD